MKNKDIKKILINEKFDDDGGDDDVNCYSTDHISIMLYNKIEKRTLSFGHGEGGYYHIKNPTIEQIKSVITIFKEASFIDTEQDIVPKIQFKLTILNMLEDFYESKQKKLSRWKSKKATE